MEALEESPIDGEKQLCGTMDRADEQGGTSEINEEPSKGRFRVKNLSVVAPPAVVTPSPPPTSAPPVALAIEGESLEDKNQKLSPSSTVGNASSSSSSSSSSNSGSSSSISGSTNSTNSTNSSSSSSGSTTTSTTSTTTSTTSTTSTPNVCIPTAVISINSSNNSSSSNGSSNSSSNSNTSNSAAVSNNQSSSLSRAQLAQKIERLLEMNVQMLKFVGGAGASGGSRTAPWENPDMLDDDDTHAPQPALPAGFDPPRESLRNRTASSHSQTLGDDDEVSGGSGVTPGLTSSSSGGNMSSSASSSSSSYAGSTSLAEKDQGRGFGKLFHLNSEMRKELELYQEKQKDGRLENQRLKEKIRQLSDLLSTELSRVAIFEDRIEKFKREEKKMREKLDAQQAMLDAHERQGKLAEPQFLASDSRELDLMAAPSDFHVGGVFEPHDAGSSELDTGVGASRALSIQSSRANSPVPPAPVLPVFVPHSQAASAQEEPAQTDNSTNATVVEPHIQEADMANLLGSLAIPGFLPHEGKRGRESRSGSFELKQLVALTGGMGESKGSDNSGCALDSGRLSDVGSERSYDALADIAARSLK